MARNPIDTADPENRKLIVDWYERRGEAFIKAEFGVTRKAINRWRSLEAETGSLAPHYFLKGRHLALSPPEIRQLEQALLKDPYLTNAELAAVVGNKITARAAGNYIRDSSHRFVTKLEQLDVEAAFKAQHAEEGIQFQKKIHNVALAKRVYVDETFFGSGVRRRTGRFPSGILPWVSRNRKYPRKTVLGAIQQGGYIQPSRIYDKGSITTGEFVHYVRHDLAPHLQRGDVVIWDLLGRSGRAKNPTALHFSPEARAAVEARGARLLLLPPAGKLFNPIESVFGETKRLYEKEIRRLTRSRAPSSLTFQQLSTAWHKAEAQTSHDTFAHAYHERATGREFERVCKEKGLLGDSD